MPDYNKLDHLIDYMFVMGFSTLEIEMALSGMNVDILTIHEKLENSRGEESTNIPQLYFDWRIMYMKLGVFMAFSLGFYFFGFFLGFIAGRI